MSTGLERRPEPSLIVGGAVVAWSAEQKDLLRQAVARDCSDAELAFFAQVCAHKGLDPFMDEICAVKRGGKMVIQEKVEGLRTIAERSGLYGGFDGPYWSADGENWKKVWLPDEPPAAALYYVRRKDWPEMVPGVARWASSVQFDHKGQIVPIWKDRPDEMLGKTAEARALRRAFPKEFARADVGSRDLTDAQLVTLEARQAGLDDQARHQLVAHVTDGRTESTRQLTPDETLVVRQEVARTQSGPPTQEPATQRRAEEGGGPAGRLGEVAPAGPTTHTITSNPGPHGQSETVTVDTTTGEIVSPEEERKALFDQLAPKRAQLNESEYRLFGDWVESCLQIPRDTPKSKFTIDQLHAIDAYLDQALEEPF